MKLRRFDVLKHGLFGKAGQRLGLTPASLMAGLHGREEPVGMVMTPGTEDLWIFAYGSLMWRPDFAFEEQRKARLFGFHRALCIYSHHYRGTPERPGLVLGLDRGGSCVGLCFRIAAKAAVATLAAVRERELVTSVYAEIAAPIRLEDGRRRMAVTYVASRDHPQYAGALPLPELMRFVAQGRGTSGPNLDYVRNTHRHLVDLGIVDPTLAALSAEPRESRPGEAHGAETMAQPASVKA